MSQTYLCWLLYVHKGCLWPIAWRKTAHKQSCRLMKHRWKGVKGLCKILSCTFLCWDMGTFHTRLCQTGTYSHTGWEIPHWWCFQLFPSPAISPSEALRSSRAVRCLSQSGVTSSHPSGLSWKCQVWFIGLLVPTRNVQLCPAGTELQRGQRAQRSSAAHLFSLDENSFQLFLCASYVWVYLPSLFYAFSISASRLWSALYKFH